LANALLPVRTQVVWGTLSGCSKASRDDAVPVAGTAVVSGSDPLDRNRDAFEQPLSVPQTTWVRTGNNALANVGILGFRLRD
jgi:hypothetical protein